MQDIECCYVALQFQRLSNPHLPKTTPEMQSMKKMFICLYPAIYSLGGPTNSFKFNCFTPLLHSWNKLAILWPWNSSLKSCLPSWITVLLWWRGWHNSMKQWAMPCTATQDGQVIVFWQNVGYWRRKWQTTSVLARRTSWYLKVKRYDTVWWVSQTGKYPICYWKRVEGNY